MFKENRDLRCLRENDGTDTRRDFGIAQGLLYLTTCRVVCEETDSHPVVKRRRTRRVSHNGKADMCPSDILRRCVGARSPFEVDELWRDAVRRLGVGERKGSRRSSLSLSSLSPLFLLLINAPGIPGAWSAGTSRPCSTGPVPRATWALILVGSLLRLLSVRGTPVLFL